MGQGETSTRRRGAWRLAAGAALLASLTTAAGCGDGSARPANDAPRVPPAWPRAAVTASPPWTAPGSWGSASPTLTSAPAPWSTPYAAWPRASAPSETPPETSDVAPLPAVADATPQTLARPESIAEPAAPLASIGTLLAPCELPEDLRRVAAPAPRDAAAGESPAPAGADRAASAPARAVTAAALRAEGGPTGAVVNQRAAARIRRGHELAERGATFAARNEFLAALRMIAEAKDDRFGAPRRTVALAEGLRALDEAADFAVDQSLPAAKLNLAVIVASHRTPAAKDLAVDGVLPQQLAEMYFRYAQTQLAAAVAGEPAGSMALHALGKLTSLMGRSEPQRSPQADRRAFALQQAALLARSDNHLAAHELAVLLAEAGHYAESESWLRQVAAQAPHPVVYRNLARVERQLGRADLAALSERQADYLASRGAGAMPNVQWVPASTLAQAPDALGPGAQGLAPFAPASQQPPLTARGPAPVLR